MHALTMSLSCHLDSREILCERKVVLLGSDDAFVDCGLDLQAEGNMLNVINFFE
jgi:hypothetical protein